LPEGQTSLPATTIDGITPPTIGRSLADPITSARTATTPEPVDRSAPTNSHAPDPVASPQHGTEALPVARSGRWQPRPSPTPLSSASAPALGGSPFQWPNERDSATSEEPHVQTVSVAFRRSSRWAARIVTVAVTTVVVTMVGVLVFARHPWAELGFRGPTTQAAMAPPPPRSAQPLASPLSPAAVWTEPARVDDTSPNLDHAAVGAERTPPGPPVRRRNPDETAASATTKAAPAPGTQPARSKPRPVASATTKPPAPPMRTDRPGPGF
jgi:hypothetical protein